LPHFCDCTDQAAWKTFIGTNQHFGIPPHSISDLSEEEHKKEEKLYLTTPEAERAAREKYGLLGILKVIRMTDPDLNTLALGMDLTTLGLNLNSPECLYAREKYGLLGILKVIRMTDPDLNMLALGMDLTTLGLNLNSPECLYATFASPWSDMPARKDPEFNLPPCYYMNPPQLKTAHLQKFSLETLFYIFFNMPRDTLQAYAAAELYNRGWKYHRELKTWFVLQQEDEGQPRWVCFDPSTWEKHYYLQPLDTTSFLGEDDVRVKMPAPGGMSSTQTV